MGSKYNICNKDRGSRLFKIRTHLHVLREAMTGRPDATTRTVFAVDNVNRERFFHVAVVVNAVGTRSLHNFGGTFGLKCHPKPQGAKHLRNITSAPTLISSQRR